jgi:hypothetical protein
MREVSITNRNPTPYEDGYHGMKFFFKPGVSVAMPEEAAEHIFGIDKEDKTDVLRRMGIANHPDGKQFLANFEVKVVEYIQKEVVEELDDLRLSVDKRDEEIQNLTAQLEALATENEQLRKKLEKAGKVAKK